jgi:hypothetical protein
MAKQTFSVGQVLTAAQMTSLQQTAMLGGAASAKTASYTLVAADAGTAISMTSTSATTITVNTGLFAAGDTVQITNLGTGVCTITTGTATVNTSASLALAQYESGTLDFTSTSAAIFIKGAGATASSGGMTLISTTNLTGSSVSLSSIPSSYNNLQLVIRDYYPSTNTIFNIRFNNDSGGNYTWTKSRNSATSNSTATDTTGIPISDAIDAHTTGSRDSTLIMDLFDYASSEDHNFQISANYFSAVSTNIYINICGFYNPSTAAAVSSIEIFTSAGTMSGGTALLYGVK